MVRGCQRFVGYNYQDRKFADFTRWESQNSGHGQRRSCASARTGAARDDALAGAVHGSRPGFAAVVPDRRELPADPLVNYQHPHDLLMEIGATYKAAGAGGGAFIGADLVGAPTLGPTPFMHRESARDNPQVPLTHHFLDSTHISYGVVRGGASRASVTIRGLGFSRCRARRPSHESRAAAPRFVGRARAVRPRCLARAGVRRSSASARVVRTVRRDANHRVGRFRRNRGVPARSTLTVAWGGNREFNGYNGDADGALLEWDFRPGRRSTLYGRAEFADKELFGLGVHPKGFSHPHVFYTIAAFTPGYIFDLAPRSWGRVGVGADATMFQMPAGLLPSGRRLQLVSRVPALAARRRGGARALRAGTPTH